MLRRAAHTVDGHADVVTGTIHRFNSDDIDQRVTHCQIMNCRQTAIDGVVPVTRSIQSESTVLAGIVATGKLLFVTTVLIRDGEGAGAGMLVGTAILGHRAAIEATDYRFIL